MGKKTSSLQILPRLHSYTGLVVSKAKSISSVCTFMRGSHHSSGRSILRDILKLIKEINLMEVEVKGVLIGY